jgi:hypothetical protein
MLVQLYAGASFLCHMYTFKYLPLGDVRLSASFCTFPVFADTISWLYLRVLNSVMTKAVLCQMCDEDGQRITNVRNVAKRTPPRRGNTTSEVVEGAISAWT